MNGDDYNDPFGFTSSQTVDKTPLEFNFSRTAMIILLANIVLGGRERTGDVEQALKVLNIVFEGKKISLIKFIRSHTGIGLVDAKAFAENHIIQTYRKNAAEIAAEAVKAEGTFNYVR